MYGVINPVGALGLVRQHCCASFLLSSERYTDTPPMVAPTVEFVPKPSLECFVLRQAVPSVVGDKTKVQSVGHRSNGKNLNLQTLLLPSRKICE